MESACQPEVVAVRPDGELRRALRALASRLPLVEVREVADWRAAFAGPASLVIGQASALALAALGERRDDPLVPPVLLVAEPEPAWDRELLDRLRPGRVEVVRRPVEPAEVALRAQRLVADRPLRLAPRDAWFTTSAKMRQLLDTVGRVAPTDLEVLIIGETGTGKELVAQTVHRLSPRAGGPFVPVDCGAIPRDLLESQLFGHVRGAFTGAHAGQMGLFEAASGGTFFLDELAELPLSLQAKLLRALQERRIRSVGARAERPIDVRVIAATSRPLAPGVAAGQFRADLYYRLNTVELALPPLRQRSADIPLLARQFLAQHGAGRVAGFTAAALEALTAFSWPGNVRELQNVVQRATLLAAGRRVELDDLPPTIRAARVRPQFREQRAAAQAAFEREYLLATLRAARGDLREAAAAAGISRATLYRLLKRHDLLHRPAPPAGSADLPS